MISQIYERLVRANPDGTITGELASSWQAMPDSAGYEFTLRDEAFFSDGSPVTAADAEFMLKRTIRGGFVRGLDRIVGAELYRSGFAESVSGIEILDKRRIRIRLKRPDVRFFLDLWNTKCSVGREIAGPAGPTLLGSGPFMVSEEDPKTGRVELQLNPYYRLARPSFGHIVVSAESGRSYDISMVNPIPDSVGYQKKHYFAAEVYFLGFNIDHPRLRSNAERRRLASLLTDDLITGTFGQRQYKVGGYIALGLFGHSTDLVAAPLPADTPVPSELAKEPVVLSSYHPKLAGIAKAYCSKLTASGTLCSVETATSQQMIAAKKTNKLQIFFARFAPFTANAENSLAVFTEGDPLNLFNNGPHDSIGRHFGEAYQALLDIPINQRERLRQQYRTLDQIVLDETMAVPMAYGTEREIWYRPNLVLPPIDTLGIMNLRIADIGAN